MTYSSAMRKFVQILALILGFCALVSCSSAKEPEDLSDTFQYLPDKSYFVNYEIDGNTVRFRYSICFVNNTKENMEVNLSAQFQKSELRGWIKYEAFYDGCDETGEMLYETVKAGETKHITFVFEGEYLGGDVNEALSFPEEILLVTKIVEEGSAP